MNLNSMQQLEQEIARDHDNIAAVIVQKDGVPVYENYRDGFSAEHAFHVFSVTKSILSLLIGIALGRGLIGSIDRHVLDFFPDYTPKRGEKTAQRVTIRDMLTMTAPFKYRSAPYTKYFSSDDWVKSSLDLLGGKGEIGAFRYTPLIGPDILSGILTKASGKSAREFANEALFAPLGIPAMQDVVFGSKEEQLSIMKDRHESGWGADPKGVSTAGWGLFLTPPDMAKLGRLCLERGSWNGRQIVPAEWIDACTTCHSRWNELSYGYLWWVIDSNERSFAALGDGGNVIYVNGQKRLVVAIASRFQPRCADRIEWIRNSVEPLTDRL